jgi:hypothetical protein
MLFPYLPKGIGGCLPVVIVVAVEMQRISKGGELVGCFKSVVVVSR